MSVDHTARIATQSANTARPASPLSAIRSASTAKASSPRHGATQTAHSPRLARRTTADQLRDALMALGNHQGEVVTHAEKAWASITFAGARHTVTLRFAGADATAAGEEFIDALPDHEFTLPGQLVADATITAADHRLIPAPELMVECELLLLEDS